MPVLADFANNDCELIVYLNQTTNVHENKEQIAQLSQRDRAARWVIDQQSNRVRWKKTQNKAITPFKVIQGHPGRYQSKVRMRLPVSDIVIDILSRAVSELSQLIVQILDTLRF